MARFWMPALLLAAGCASAVRLEPFAPEGVFRAPGASSLSVFVDGTDGGPLFGALQSDAGALVFRPRFPLKAGESYRAVVDGTRERVFSLPAPPPPPPTELVRVYPSSAVLPENQLKFYLHFSAPMSRGEAYRRVSLLEGGVRKVELPFLEIGEELWDRSGTRLTLLIDPGRIKSGLRPREEDGPALEKGKSYVLRVDPAWRDAAGFPLKAEHRKSFAVAGPEERMLNPKQWRFEIPRPGTRDPLGLRFDKPLDAGLLARVIEVRDARDRIVEGRGEADLDETRWRFVPAAPWRAGGHALLIESVLEDLAGNSLERPFEVDVILPSEPNIAPKRLRLPFTIPE